MIEYDNDRDARFETMMKQWSSWVLYHVGGGRGTWPRDAFEALIDYYEEKLEGLDNIEGSK